MIFPLQRCTVKIRQHKNHTIVFGFDKKEYMPSMLSKSLSNFWMNCWNSLFFSDTLTLAPPRVERKIRWIAMKTSKDVITVVVVGTMLLTEMVSVAVECTSVHWHCLCEHVSMLT